MDSAVLLAAARLSTSFGLVAACFLWLFFLFGQLTRVSGWATLGASTLLVLWLACLRIALGAAEGPLPFWFAATVLAELATYAAWIGVCLRALGIGPRHLRTDDDPGKTTILRIALGASATFLAIGVAQFLWVLHEARTSPLPVELIHGARLGAAITGLLLAEQVARNTRRDFQWNLKFLVVAMVIVYGYAFVLYADAVLFGRPSGVLVAAHGAVLSLAMPFLLIATLRNRSHPLNVNLSRRLVFRTSSLVLTGGYLLLISVGGFWIRRFGGDWGAVVAVLFVAAAVVLGIAVAASRTLRERFNLALAQNLFAQKHDYREEWLRLTEALLDESDESPLPRRAIRALGEIVHAHRGGIWRLEPAGVLLPLASLHTGWDVILPDSATAALTRRVRKDPEPFLIHEEDRRDDDAEYARILRGLEGAFLAVPLLAGERFYGLVVLTAPGTGERIDWEDRELLRIAASQSASFLAQHDAQALLGEAQRLAAFNQMTAFVVHDLKTVVAQLSLLVRNAERHRSNPAFVDDMVSTTQHAVQRMQALLEHLRGAREARPPSPVALRPLLETVARRQQRLRPDPRVHCPDGLAALAHGEQLASVVAHIVQNAQEATPDDGQVTIEARQADDWVEIDVVDDGPGMDPHFVASRLFRPFESTKGVAGMGIGTWQAREYARSVGGELDVRSTLGEGTRFRFRLPAPAAELRRTA